MRRAVLRMRGSTAGTDSRRLSRSVALSAKDLITGASYNVRASRLARRNSRGASARRLSRGRHCDRHAAPRRAPALSPLGFATGTREGARKLCLWSPARRTNPGIEPRARGPATGDPRLRALSASRHRTRIGHRARARCPNLLQRRPRTPRTADRTAESCGFISATRTPQRPLQQIWTTRRPLDHPQPDGTRPTTPNEPGHTRRGGPARRARHSPRAESPGHRPRPRTRADRPGGRPPRASRPRPDRSVAPGRPRPRRGLQHPPVAAPPFDCHREDPSQRHHTFLTWWESDRPGETGE